MTMLQLRVAIATAELGSVTSAAKALNISQPNASNSLKLLEEEIGFPIFLRSSVGTTTTPRGVQFLTYARQILDTNEKVMSLRDRDEVYRLHLGTVNYYAAAEPFFTLLAENRDNPKNDFFFCTLSIRDGIQELINHNLDVLAVPVMKHQVVGLKRACELAHLELIPICEIPAVLTVRRGHPAEADGRCENITQGSDALKDYPYIGIRNLAEEAGSIGYNDSDFVQCSYKIFADDTNTRLRIISETNGFGFSILSSYRSLSQYNLDRFLVPGVSLELFCLTCEGAARKQGVSDYLALLRTEMEQLING